MKDKNYNIEEKSAKLSDNEIEPTAFDMVNKYGTYEIQPSNDTDNTFPAIAQGLSTTDKSKRASRHILP